METLPEHLRLNSDDTSFNQKHITSLHLSFNQVSQISSSKNGSLTTEKCLILATRPTLHVLIQLSKAKHASANIEGGHDTVSQASLALAEACIHSAQHSHSLIIQEWINGSLPTFGYFYAQYLFSSALILGISSVVHAENANNDMEAFETAASVLHCMSDNGNFAAKEFVGNLHQVKLCLQTYKEGREATKYWQREWRCCSS